MTSTVMPESRAAGAVAALDTVIADVIAPNAAGVDETGAFPREGVDALASRVMAPTTEALHDFVARAGLGLPLFGEEDPCC